MTPTQQLIIDRLKAGHTLMWSDSGPEMSGYPFWPQKRTVRAMLKAGLLKWNESQIVINTCDGCGKQSPLTLFGRRWLCAECTDYGN